MMKRITVFCLSLSLILVSSNLFSQEENNETTRKSNIVKFSISNFVASNFQMGYEKYLSDDFSLNINAGFTYSDVSYDSKIGFNTDLQFRYSLLYAEQKSVKRLYLAPYILYRYTELEDEVWLNDPPYNNYYDDFYFQSIGGGVLFGFTLIANKRFVMDVYTGGGLRALIDSNDDNDYYDDFWEPGHSGILPRAGVEIGFFF